MTYSENGYCRKVGYGPVCDGDVAVTCEDDGVLVILEATLGIDLNGAGSAVVTAADFDDGSFGVEHWKIELVNGSDEVVQSSNAATAGTTALTLNCAIYNESASWTVRITGYGVADPSEAYMESCGKSEDAILTIGDPMFACA